MATELNIVCPAGSPVAETDEGGPGCRCGIELLTIAESKNPSTIRRLCGAEEGADDAGPVGHVNCPSWQTMRRAEWENREKELAAMVEATA